MVLRYTLLVVLSVIAILMAAPLVLTVFTSLKPATELGNPPWYPPLSVTFEHYVRVWTEGGFNRYFLNTIIISAVDAVVMIVIASLAAYAMIFMQFRFKGLVQFVFLVGLMIPVTAIILPLYSIVRAFDLVNTHLGVILADVDVTSWPMYRRARDGGMGYLAQEQSVFRKLSVEDNIAAVLSVTTTQCHIRTRDVQADVASPEALANTAFMFIAYGAR